MLDRRLSLVLGIAIVVAIVSGFSVLHLLQAAQAEARPSMATLLVARVPLPEGHHITLDDLLVREVPTSAVPTDAFRSADAAVGRVTRVAVFPGEAILPGRLAPDGATGGLSVRIAPGKRAMAVRLDEETGQAGLLETDSRVDVLVTVGDTYGGPPVSRVIMQNMRVLAVGSASAAATDAPVSAIATTVTLEVTPTEAERLAVATSQGRLQLMLRGFGDPEPGTTTGASLADMLPEVAVAMARARASAVAQGTAPAALRSGAGEPAVSLAGSTALTNTPSASSAASSTDSTVVRVYRGDQRTEQRFARRDSTGATP
jgi:pilus assembly protein CpaB